MNGTVFARPKQRKIWLCIPLQLLHFGTSANQLQDINAYLHILYSNLDGFVIVHVCVFVCCAVSQHSTN